MDADVFICWEGLPAGRFCGLRLSCLRSQAPNAASLNFKFEADSLILQEFVKFLHYRLFSCCRFYFLSSALGAIAILAALLASY